MSTRTPDSTFREHDVNRIAAVLREVACDLSTVITETLADDTVVRDAVDQLRACADRLTPPLCSHCALVHRRKRRATTVVDHPAFPPYPSCDECAAYYRALEIAPSSAPSTDAADADATPVDSA